jgi:hypothetical protein
MPEDHAADEKSYHDWLLEALARDEKTWAALEARMKSARTPHPAEADAKDGPRDC